MFCTACGHRNPEGATFCHGCGERLGAQAGGSTAAASLRPTARTRRQIATGLLALLAVVAVGYLVSRHHKDSRAATADSGTGDEAAPPGTDEVPQGFTLLAATVHTVGKDFDGKTIIARLENGKTLSDLRIMKNVDNGILRIEFVMDYSHPCPSCVFLVRLFDKNGAHLTHFETEAHYKLLGVQRHGRQAQALSYSVSQRDLQFATSAEFGFEVP